MSFSIYIFEGQVVRLTLARKGTPGTIDVEATIDAGRERSPAQSGPQRVAFSPLLLYPVPAVLVAVIELALRTHDRNDWLLALVFAGFGVGPVETVESVNPPSLRGFLLAYSALFSNMAPAFFYALLARFPASSSVDRRLPWLRWVMALAAAALFVPLAAAVLAAGSQWPPVRALTRPGVEALDRAVVAYVSSGTALRQQGFLVEHGRRGLQVAPVDRGHFDAIYEFRSVLEPWAASLAAQRMTPQLLARGRALVERGQRVAAAGDAHATLQADIDFHNLLYEASGNPLVLESMPTALAAPAPLDGRGAAAAALHRKGLARARGDPRRHRGWRPEGGIAADRGARARSAGACRCRARSRGAQGRVGGLPPVRGDGPCLSTMRQ